MRNKIEPVTEVVEKFGVIPSGDAPDTVPTTHLSNKIGIKPLETIQEEFQQSSSHRCYLVRQ